MGAEQVREGFMPGSIPIELVTLKGQIAVRWVDAANADFTRPFLKDTINRQIDRGCKQTLTLATELAQLPRRQPPSAFIFHMSRCGSTLASRMLSAVERFHVVSEPGCISDALSLESIDERAREVLVHELINALVPEAKACFFKLTSWNLFHLALFRKLYPHTPWLFIYRDPVEVLASHARAPAAWRRRSHLVGTCNELGVQIEEESGPIETVAQILACLCTHAAQNYDPSSSLLLNYDELPVAMYKKVATFLELDLLETEASDMHAVSLHHSKDLGRSWVGGQSGFSDLTKIQLISKKYLEFGYEQLQVERC